LLVGEVDAVERERRVAPQPLEPRLLEPDVVVVVEVVDADDRVAALQQALGQVVADEPRGSRDQHGARAGRASAARGAPVPALAHRLQYSTSPRSRPRSAALTSMSTPPGRRNRDGHDACSTSSRCGTASTRASRSVTAESGCSSMPYSRFASSASASGSCTSAATP